MVGGIVSPVSDSYGKQGLVLAKHRVAMAELALQSSNWVTVDEWESQQPDWTETVVTMRYKPSLLLEISFKIKFKKKSCNIVQESEWLKQFFFLFPVTLYEHTSQTITCTVSKSLAIRWLIRNIELVETLCCVFPVK